MNLQPVCSWLLLNSLCQASDSVFKEKREARRSTSAPHLDRYRLRLRVGETFEDTVEESTSETETPQDRTERSEETPEVQDIPLPLSPNVSVGAESPKRTSRIQRDSSGRRIIKGNADKPVTLNLPAVHGGQQPITKPRRVSDSAGYKTGLSPPEGYSDWDEVARDDLDIEILRHIRARILLEEFGKKVLARGLSEGIFAPHSTCPNHK